jgi:hypothetical protein
MTDDRTLSDYLREFTVGGLRPAIWLDCPCLLHGDKRSEHGDRRRHRQKIANGICERLPYQDHVRGFINLKTGERVLTHHPYYSPNDLPEIIKATKEFAERHHLTVEISNRSWYSKRTLLIEYRKK